MRWSVEKASSRRCSSSLLCLSLRLWLIWLFTLVLFPACALALWSPQKLPMDVDLPPQHSNGNVKFCKAFPTPQVQGLLIWDYTLILDPLTRGNVHFIFFWLGWWILLNACFSGWKARMMLLENLYCPDKWIDRMDAELMILLLMCRTEIRVSKQGFGYSGQKEFILDEQFSIKEGFGWVDCEYLTGW